MRNQKNEVTRKIKKTSTTTKKLEYKSGNSFDITQQDNKNNTSCEEEKQEDEKSKSKNGSLNKQSL
jgi:hypothetical protein